MLAVTFVRSTIGVSPVTVTESVRPPTLSVTGTLVVFSVSTRLSVSRTGAKPERFASTV